MENKDTIGERKQMLIKMTGKFCSKHLDEEYRNLCERLIQKMSRKRNVPFIYGSIEIWAAAVVHAIGRINFLFDKSFKPYISAEDISRHFGASKSTVSQKAKVIRDMFKLQYWDEEFSTEYMKKKDPFANLVMVNGMIVDISDLPKEAQENTRQKRLNESKKDDNEK